MSSYADSPTTRSVSNMVAHWIMGYITFLYNIQIFIEHRQRNGGAEDDQWQRPRHRNVEVRILQVPLKIGQEVTLFFLQQRLVCEGVHFFWPIFHVNPAGCGDASVNISTDNRPGWEPLRSEVVKGQLKFWKVGWWLYLHKQQLKTVTSLWIKQSMWEVELQVQLEGMNN